MAQHTTTTRTTAIANPEISFSGFALLRPCSQRQLQLHVALERQLPDAYTPTIQATFVFGQLKSNFINFIKFCATFWALMTV